jgi:hypothetical protein
MSTVTDMASLEDLMAALKASGTDKIIMADTAYIWAQAGYLNPEGSQATQMAEELMKNGAAILCIADKSESTETTALWFHTGR